MIIIITHTKKLIGKIFLQDIILLCATSPIHAASPLMESQAIAVGQPPPPRVTRKSLRNLGPGQAINVRMQAGTATSALVFLRWGEAQA